MVVSNDTKVSKTAFVSEFLREHKTANSKAVNTAWTESGHSGSISQSLFNNLRSELGLTGNPRIRSKPAEASGVTKATTVPKKAAKSRKATLKSNGKVPAQSNGEQTKQTNAAPVPAKKPRDQGKTAFVREVLVANPLANATAVKEAWKSAGKEGTISDSLVKVTRSELGLTGNLRKGRKSASARSAANAAKTKKAAPTTKVAKKAQNDVSRAVRAPVKKQHAAALDRVIAEVERDIDRLIFQLMGVGGLLDIEDALRRVRRQLVVTSHTA